MNPYSAPKFKAAKECGRSGKKGGPQLAHVDLANWGAVCESEQGARDKWHARWSDGTRRPPHLEWGGPFPAPQALGGLDRPKMVASRGGRLYKEGSISAHNVRPDGEKRSLAPPTFGYCFVAVPWIVPLRAKYCPQDGGGPSMRRRHLHPSRVQPRLGRLPL